jgi:predicted permease
LPGPFVTSEILFVFVLALVGFFHFKKNSEQTHCYKIYHFFKDIFLFFLLATFFILLIRFEDFGGVNKKECNSMHDFIVLIIGVENSWNYYYFITSDSFGKDKIDISAFFKMHLSYHYYDFSIESGRKSKDNSIKKVTPEVVYD